MIKSPDGTTLWPGNGDPYAEQDVTDTAELGARMFGDTRADLLPSQATAEMAATQHAQAARSATMTGAALSSVPFGVYLPEALEEPVAKWREALQAAQDADAQVHMAAHALTQARKAAVEAEVDGTATPMPDFATLRAAVDEAEIKAEARLRQASRATQELRRLIEAEYPAWRAYILDAFGKADEDVHEALARLNRAEAVRDDMLRAVIELDSTIGAAKRPLVTKDGTPGKKDLQIGARQAVNGALQSRARALSEYVKNLVRPATFDWTPDQEEDVA